MTAMQAPGIPTLYKAWAGNDPAVPKMDVHDWGEQLALFGRIGDDNGNLLWVTRNKNELAQYFNIPDLEVDSLVAEYGKVHKANKGAFLDAVYRIAVAVEKEAARDFRAYSDLAAGQEGLTGLQVVEYEIIHVAEAMSVSPPRRDAVTSPPPGNEPAPIF